MSRRKGAVGERETAAKLNEVLGTRFHRGRQYHGWPESPDLAGDLPGLHLDVKRCERLSLYPAMAKARRGFVGRTRKVAGYSLRGSDPTAGRRGCVLGTSGIAPSRQRSGLKGRKQGFRRGAKEGRAGGRKRGAPMSMNRWPTLGDVPDQRGKWVRSQVGRDSHQFSDGSDGLFQLVLTFRPVTKNWFCVKVRIRT
jgi:hypothetical protein